MSPGGKVPDAWDDDWVSRADSSTANPDPVPSSTKISKAERRAKQAEFNRQLWQEAEAPEGSYYVTARDDVPLKTEFKPAVKVLSRKPVPKKAVCIDAITGLERLTVDDDEDDDDDDTRKIAMTMEQRQQKAHKEREEKQRKYEEARERLFGADKTSKTTSSGNTTPPVARSNGDPRNQSRNKSSKDSRPASATGGKNRQLYDPNYTTKPESLSAQKIETPMTSGRSTPGEQQPIRSPRGPDHSGRGGFGFSPRGGRVS